jgi:hypothetical protein
LADFIEMKPGVVFNGVRIVQIETFPALDRKSIGVQFRDQLGGEAKVILPAELALGLAHSIRRWIDN